MTEAMKANDTFNVGMRAEAAIPVWFGISMLVDVSLETIFLSSRSAFLRFRFVLIQCHSFSQLYLKVHYN